MKINIVVNLQVDGIHRWADCPIEEVSFLRDFHRHMFHIRCEKSVEHSDRDIEIIQFKRNILGYLHSRYYDSKLRTHNFGNKSCEDIAIELLKTHNLYQIEVNEDGENGAIVRKYY